MPYMKRKAQPEQGFVPGAGGEGETVEEGGRCRLQDGAVVVEWCGGEREEQGAVVGAEVGEAAGVGVVEVEQPAGGGGEAREQDSWEGGWQAGGMLGFFDLSRGCW